MQCRTNPADSTASGTVSFNTVHWWCSHGIGLSLLVRSSRCRETYTRRYVSLRFAHDLSYFSLATGSYCRPILPSPASVQHFVKPECGAASYLETLLAELPMNERRMGCHFLLASTRPLDHSVFLYLLHVSQREEYIDLPTELHFLDSSGIAQRSILPRWHLMQKIPTASRNQ